jgi:hypothetical protein
MRSVQARFKKGKKLVFLKVYESNSATLVRLTAAKAAAQFQSVPGNDYEHSRRSRVRVILAFAREEQINFEQLLREGQEQIEILVRGFLSNFSGVKGVECLRSRI